MTQQEVAFKLNVTRQSVSKWENGMCCPKIVCFLKLIDLYEVDIDFFTDNYEKRNLEVRYKDNGE